jgi:hypothetical protein
MKYDGGKRKGGGFVIKNDLAKHLQTCWEFVYLPLYLEMKNPSDKWLGMFMYPTAYLAVTLPRLFDENFRRLREDIEGVLPIKEEDFVRNNLRSYIMGTA